jgi:hypothetical protein
MITCLVTILPSCHHKLTTSCQFTANLQVVTQPDHKLPIYRHSTAATDVEHMSCKSHVHIIIVMMTRDPIL